MKYLICIVAVLFCASVANAGCANGRCHTPVRTAVKATAKAIGKVAKAPFRCHCKGGCR